MKYLKLYESFEDITEICKKYGIENYTINPDGSIDVDGVCIDGISYYFDLAQLKLTKLPLKFNKVNCNFFCYFNQLTTLEGSPKEVNGNFNCSKNQLTSFEFAPRIIRGDFNCRYNNIKTFEYFPSYVSYSFICNNNPIYEVWKLFCNKSKIELLNDFDIFRDEDTNNPGIVMERLNDFLLTIGRSRKIQKYIEYEIFKKL